MNKVVCLQQERTALIQFSDNILMVDDIYHFISTLGEPHKTTYSVAFWDTLPDDDCGWILFDYMNCRGDHDMDKISQAFIDIWRKGRRLA